MPDFVPTTRDAPTMVAGLRNQNTTLSNRIVVDMADEILLYMPSAAPLTTLTGKVRRKRKAIQPRFDWLTKDEFPRTSTVSGAVLVGATTVNVAAGHGDRIAANYVLLNLNTREQILVTAVSTDALTVVRGIGSTAAAMADGDQLVFLRPVFEDGSDIGTLKSVKEADEYNYTEIIRTAFGWTRRQANTDMYGGRDPMTERKWQGIEHEKSIEHMMYFGRRHTRTGSGGNLQTFSGGLEYFIQSNIWDLNSNKPSERAWLEFLEEVMRWGEGGNQQGAGTKYLIASSRWVTEINGWAQDRVEYRPSDTTLGISMMEFKSPHGRVMIIKSPILDYAHPDFAFLVDLNHIRYAYLQNSDTMLLKEREGNGVDGSEEEYLSDVGCQVELEASHAILKGLPV